MFSLPKKFFLCNKKVMALNFIWLFLLLTGFLIGFVKFTFLGDNQILSDIVNRIFDDAQTGFKLSLGLVAVLSFWLGIMKIGEKSGAVNFLAKALRPFLKRIFPKVPENHPAMGAMVMNIAANMLGLDNAATPMGLKAMRELQELNPEKDTASDAQIMFLVLNTSGLTIIPISVITYRASLGAANPTDIFLPILLATFFSTLGGLIFVAIIQKIKLWDPVIIAYLGSLTALVFILIFWLKDMPPQKLQIISKNLTAVILLLIIAIFLISGIVKKINVYETFIEGAKDGFNVAVMIIPYLIAILVAIGVFRVSGAMDWLIKAMKYIFSALHINTDFVPALPTAFMKPLSGSGARGMMIEACKTYGVDSFVARVASTIQGSTDTTFYILAVYFGAVNIKKTRYAAIAGLFADFVGIIAAIIIAYIFFY